MAPATGCGASVDVLGGSMVIVDWSVGDTVWILGKTSIGEVEVVEMDEKPLGEKENSVPGFVGIGVADVGEDEVVGPRPNVSFMLSLEEEGEGETADAAVAGGWDEINGNVSPLLPLVVAAAGIGAGVVDTEVELTIGVALLVGGDRVVVTVIMTVVKITLRFVLPVGLGTVLFEAAGVGELFGFAAGIEGKAVSGGDEPGLLPTAGTIPTMPPLATAVD